MIRHHGAVSKFLLALLPLLLPAAASAQATIGQYEDEAPLFSWNLLAPPSGAALALGSASTARAFDLSCAFANPALLAGRPDVEVSVSGFLRSASLYRFSLVNTGPVTSAGPVSVSSGGADFAGLSCRFGGWTVAASVSMLEDYGRPALAIDQAEGGTTYYSLEATQGGMLRAWQAAVARRIAPGLSAGLALAFAEGSLDRRVRESWPTEPATIADTRTHRLRSVFLVAGVSWRPVPRLSAGLSVRSPWTLSDRAAARLEFAGATSFAIDAASRDRARRPWTVAAGAAFDAGPELLVVADVAWFGWSRYSATSFGETLARRFRDTVRAGAGVEYALRARVLGRGSRVPLRLGVALDPQPMEAPRSSYLDLTAGLGWETGRLRLDAGLAFGKERGSGDGLSRRRFVLTASYGWTR